MPTTASGWRCTSSGSVEEGIAARERAFEAYVQADRCDEAARVGVWVSHQYLLSGRASAARGWLARAERAVEDAECEGQGWVAIERARHAASLEERAEHARRAMAIARESGNADLEIFALSLLGLTEVNAGPPGERHAAARGGDGGGVRGAGAQRAHARRGLLQPDHGLHQRGRLGARRGVVRAGGRVRARARHDAAARRVPHHPRRRPRGERPLARGRAGAGDRARDPRAVRARDGRARPSRAWPSCACARAGSPRPSSCSPGARSTRRRCARWRTCASPTAGRRSRPRCWSARSAPPRATPSAPRSCSRRSSTRVWRAGTWRARASPRRSSPSSRRARGSAWWRPAPGSRPRT